MSPTVVPSPASKVRGGLAILVSAIGGEVALLSAGPRGGVAACGGVAVRESSTSDSPMTLGSADIMQEGEADAPRSCCGSTTDPHNNAT
jgi:hypothetical protein